MSEFIDTSDIFSQFDAFEIANLILSKEYNIWAARKSMNADLPIFTLPPPINIYGGLD